MRLKIIIVDDNPAVLRHLVSLLETEFEVVATADNGLSGLECIRRHMPDLVVIDLAMPILNGIELINELKNMPSYPAVVICSSESDPEIVEVARQAGALGYVFKMRMSSDLRKALKLAAQGKPFISPS
jgi:DNA-binding NarL/FixJ family response regulator